MIPYSDIIINGTEINPMTVLIVATIVLVIIVAVYYAKRI